jgi:hypothetical protein
MTPKEMLDSNAVAVVSFNLNTKMYLKNHLISFYFRHLQKNYGGR